MTQSTYIPGAIPIPGYDLSFSLSLYTFRGGKIDFFGHALFWSLKDLKDLIFSPPQVYARVRRCTSPDEQKFCPKEQLPQSMLPADLEYSSTSMTNEININDRLEAIDRRSILSLICKEGDGQIYGSCKSDLERSVPADTTLPARMKRKPKTDEVRCSQALSKWTHFSSENSLRKNPTSTNEALGTRQRSRRCMEYANKCKCT